MIFELLLGNPWPWVFAAGLCAGAAASSLTRIPARARDPERARERRGFAAALAVTLFIVLVLCAVFIPGAEKMRDPGLAVFFFAVAAVFFLVFRFRKAAGLPFLALSAVAILAVALFFRAVTAFTGETEIARLRVREADGKTMRFELVDRAGRSTDLSMPGTLLGAETKEIVFHDVFVFFGARTAYRFLGLKSAAVPPGSEMTQELRAYELPRPEGVPEAFYRFVEANQHLLPFVKTAQVQVTYAAVKPGAEYSIRVQHDSGAEIMRTSLKAE